MRGIKIKRCGHFDYDDTWCAFRRNDLENRYLQDVCLGPSALIVTSYREEMTAACFTFVGFLLESSREW